ncbi:MAG: 30S ribosomal protein S21 [Planctomycetes bacterium]|nr:30S ribosomal protein S21 [Planctomycetota bacterium]
MQRPFVAWNSCAALSGSAALWLKVKARSSESVDQLLRRFKKACEKEGLTRSMKRVAFYEKPSVVENRKRRQALKRKLQATMLAGV